MKKKRLFKYAFRADAPKFAATSGKDIRMFQEFLDGSRNRGIHSKGEYLLYEVLPKGVRIVDIHVKEPRQGTGTQLIEKLEKETIKLGGCFFEAAVPEDNLPMQMLLKSMDFRCEQINKTKSNTYYLFRKVK